MKKITMILFLLAISTFVYSQDFQVSNTGIYSVDYPHLALGNSTVHLVYGTNFRYYSFNEDGSGIPIDNPTTPAENYGPNSVDIAVDPADNNHIAIIYYDFHYDQTSGIQFYGCYLTESVDGGSTFDTPTLLDTIQLGNSISNLQYDMPKVKFLLGDEGTTLKALWRVNTNNTDTNALYLGDRYSKIRVDDPNSNALEQAIGMNVDDMISISYGVMEDGHAKFYLTDENGPKLVKDDGQTFITSDHFSKAFKNHGGKIQYIFSDFAHPAKLMVSDNWGETWNDMGIIDSHPYSYVAFERITPTPPKYLESYYVKLVLDDNGNLVFAVSKDLMNWQDGGKINSDAAQIEMASVFVDLKLDDKNNFLLSSWIDNRTGNNEIFYSRTPLPEIVSVDDESILPTKMELSQNYPNPFNPTTMIKYSISRSGFVSLNVYNALGQKVANLVNSEQNQGNYEVQFNANNLPSGIYFYTITANNFSSTKKMLLIK